MRRKFIFLFAIVLMLSSLFTASFVIASDYCPECGYPIGGHSDSCSGDYRNANSAVCYICSVDPLDQTTTCQIWAYVNYWTERTYYHINPLKPPCSDNRYSYHMERWQHAGCPGVPHYCDYGFSAGEWENICPY